MRPGLRFKFLFIFIGISLLFVFAIILSYVNMGSLHFEADKIGKHFREYNKAVAITSNLYEAGWSSHFYTMYDDKNYAVSFRKEMNEANRKLDAIRRNKDIDREELILIPKIEAQLRRANFDAATLFTIEKPSGSGHAEELSDQVEMVMRETIDMIKDHKNDEVAAINVSLSSAADIRDSRRNLLIVLMLLCLFVAGSFVAVNTSIINPILLISKKVESVSRGDFNQRLSIHTGDEIEILAEAFNQMAFNLWQEEETAAEIQKRLLPQIKPRPQGVQLHSRQVQAKIIGGDWFDYYQLPNEKILNLLIADASGKGMPGALLSTVAMSAIRSEPKQTKMLDTLRKTNQTIENRLGGGDFVTLLYISLDLESKRLDYINCGHEPPLIFSPTDGTWSIFELESGLPLGVTTDVFAPGIGSVDLSIGSKVILYTDGLSAAKQNNRYFTIEDAIAWLTVHKETSVEPLMDGLLEKTMEFCDNRLLDDVTLLGFEITG